MSLHFVPSYTTTTTNNSSQQEAAWGQHSYANSSSIAICSKPPSLHPPRKFPFPLNLFFMTSSHPRRGQPAFRLALDGWPKRKIFGDLTSFNHRTCPSHLKLSFTIALESGIEPPSSSTFRSTHASEPYLTTVITVPSNILILVCKLIFLLFRTFFFTGKKKHPEP